MKEKRKPAANKSGAKQMHRLMCFLSMQNKTMHILCKIANIQIDCSEISVLLLSNSHYHTLCSWTRLSSESLCPNTVDYAIPVYIPPKICHFHCFVNYNHGLVF